MAVELKRYRFTRVDYHRMGQAGILKPNVRVELIDGDIVEMNPIGRFHKAGVNRLSRIFHQGVGDDAIVQVQSSIVLDDHGEPEPDIVLLRYRDDFYGEADAEPDDVLLIIEVADSSESYDRRIKAPLYARFNIAELWIVDVSRAWITVYTDPTADGYATTRVFRRGEALTPLAFPQLTIAVNDVLGQAPSAQD